MTIISEVSAELELQKNIRSHEIIHFAFSAHKMRLCAESKRALGIIILSSLCLLLIDLLSSSKLPSSSNARAFSCELWREPADPPLPALPARWKVQPTVQVMVNSLLVPPPPLMFDGATTGTATRQQQRKHWAHMLRIHTNGASPQAG